MLVARFHTERDVMMIDSHGLTALGLGSQGIQAAVDSAMMAVLEFVDDDRTVHAQFVQKLEPEPRQGRNNLGAAAWLPRGAKRSTGDSETVASNANMELDVGGVAATR